MNTLVEKEMWLVECGLTVYPIVAYTDSETGEIYFYKYDDESHGDGVYHIIPDEIAFSSKEQAEGYVAGRMEYFKVKAPEVKEYLENITVINEKKRPVDVHSLLPGDLMGDYAYIKTRRDEYRAENALLKNYIRTGMLNIGGQSIPKDFVNRILYISDEQMQVVIESRWLDSVMTTNSAEIELLKTVFGDCTSFWKPNTTV